MPRRFEFEWTLDLRSSPEAVWARVADTDRFNRDCGLPHVIALPERTAADPLARIVRLRWFGQTVEWEEQPFEWEAPRWFSVRRRYLRGPIAELFVHLTLAPAAAGGTRLTYRLDARARSLLGDLIIPVQLGAVSAAKFRRVFERYDRAAERDSSREAAPDLDGTISRASREPPPANLPAPLAAARRALLDADQPGDLVDRLLALVRSGDDLTLQRLRPYGVARAWGAPPRHVLTLMLHATRAGLLDLSWDLICPACRGAKARAGSLRDVRRDVHCDACRIDFTVRFDQSVELTFRPNATARTLGPGLYCLGGPQRTPHIAAQRIVESGRSATLAPATTAGSWRLRTTAGRSRQRVPAISLDITPDAPATLDLTRTPDLPARAALAPSGSIVFSNRCDGALVVSLERTAWADDACTAAEATSLQTFRDLFATEALRPEERIDVGSITLLFTDLKGSTRLYREIGDAPAFGRVMTHFDILRDEVASRDGTIVKTMGDAIMAAFTSPADAVFAALAAQFRLTRDLSQRGTPLELKAAVHCGPCIAVNLNDRLDYFGTVVNIAARHVPLCDGPGVIVSEEAMNHPAIAAAISDGRLSGAADSIECRLKGLETEPRRAYRLVEHPRTGASS